MTDFFPLLPFCPPPILNLLSYVSPSVNIQTFTLATAPFDARFPNTNQSKHCFSNYVDYFRCINAKGEDFPACKQVSTSHDACSLTH